MMSHRPFSHRLIRAREPGLRPVCALALGALAGAALLAAPAFAQGLPGTVNDGTGSAVTAGPDAAGPRYAFAPVEGGALKLDRQTGQVSLCAKGPAGFTCEAVPDSRDAYEAEIARLQKEIAALKGAPAPNAGTGTGPTDTTELDQALDYAERIYRRLKSMIDGLRSSGNQDNI